MACVLTSGYDFATVCKTVAGSSEVLITEFSNLVTAPTVTAGVITTQVLATGKQFRQYKIDNELISATSDLAVNAAGSTIMYEPKVEFSIKGWSAVLATEIRLLALNKLIVIVKGNDGVYRQYGTYKGLDVVTATDQNEAAMNGFKGHKISLAGKETVQAYEISSSLITILLAPAV
jgi:hypothetical protein